MVPEIPVPERPTHPGLLLRQRFLDPLGISPRQLALAIGVRTRRLEELLGARGRLTPDIALRLGLFFDVPARWFLDLQSDFDASDEGRLAELRSIVTPFPRRDGVLITPTGARHMAPKAGSADPMSMSPTPELLARLRAQVALNPPRPEREPVVVYLPDGRPMLTGRDG